MDDKCIIIVDIKGSTKLSEYQRRQLQNNIFSTLDRLKTAFSDTLFSTSMTLGDEFQIVIDSPERALDIFQFLSAQLETEFYFGVGLGAVEAIADRTSPSEMYGKAFYLAREAILHSKKEQIHMMFATGNEKLDFELNTISELILFIRGKWTKRQKTILNCIEKHPEAKRKEIAADFGVSEQAISKLIKTSGYEPTKKAFQLAKTVLASLG